VPRVVSEPHKKHSMEAETPEGECRLGIRRHAGFARAMLTAW